MTGSGDEDLGVGGEQEEVVISNGKMIFRRRRSLLMKVIKVPELSLILTEHFLQQLHEELTHCALLGRFMKVCKKDKRKQRGQPQ